jgi:opacity protein-like surface antigen
MKIVYAAIAFALLGASAASAADNKVLDHHVTHMKSGNLEEVLADYAPDAVIVTPAGMISPNGVFIGKDARKLFSVLTNKENLPGNKTMQVTYESLSPDTTLMRWVQYKGTPKQISGYDVFVIRGSRIVFQSVNVDAKK